MAIKKENTLYESFTQDQLMDAIGDFQGDGASQEKGGSWCAYSYDEAKELVRAGWPEGLQLLRDAKVQIDKAAAEHQATSYLYDVSGSFVDVGKYLQGDPECMVEFVERVTPRMISIGLCLTVSASVDKQAIRNRGAVVMALCERLEDAGYRIRVNGYYSVSDWGKHGHVISIRLKDFGTTLDADRLAFWTCNEAALRRIAFRYQEKLSPEVRQRFGYKSGHGYGLPYSDKGFFDLGGDDVLFHVMRQSSGFNSAREAAERLNTLAKLLTDGKRRIEITEGEITT